MSKREGAPSKLPQWTQKCKFKKLIKILDFILAFIKHKLRVLFIILVNPFCSWIKKRLDICIWGTTQWIFFFYKICMVVKTATLWKVLWCYTKRGFMTMLFQRCKWNIRKFKSWNYLESPGSWLGSLDLLLCWLLSMVLFTECYRKSAVHQ